MEEADVPSSEEVVPSNNDAYEEAQKVAFEKTYQAIIKTLNEEAYKYLQSVYGDLDEYIKTRIESEVKMQKKA